MLKTNINNKSKANGLCNQPLCACINNKIETVSHPIIECVFVSLPWIYFPKQRAQIKFVGTRREMEDDGCFLAAVLDLTDKDMG